MADLPFVPGVLDGSDDEVSADPSATVVAQPIKVTQELRRRAWALSSVLKVFVTKVDPNYAQPWQMCPQRSSTGSAFVIDTDQRTILTNSHVVSNATAIYVRRPGSAKKFKAELICDGKVCDLALLTVRDDAFWAAELRGLKFVDVPELQSPIAVAGYPVGGDNISVTKGIVSRIALVRYSATARLLSIQIDAAINPGNSGGPAFADLEQGLVAGVAFSKNVASSTDNIGYIIPHRVVAHFLEEAAARPTSTYRGVPSPGFSTQDLENPAQRAYLQLAEGRSGVMVVRTDPLSAAAGVLRTGDVLMELDGRPIADDGTVEFRADERLEYSHLVRAKHIGESIHLLILRGGQELGVEYRLACKDHLVPVLHGVDAQPSYLIVGGLVFTPLSNPFLEMVFGGGRRSRRSEIPVAVMAAVNRDKTRKGQQVVLLVQVLAAELNHGYRYSVVPCETFNGTRLHSLRHLAALADGCTETHLNFGLEGGRLITLARAEVDAQGPAILSTNAISADRSLDMLEPRPADEDWEAWAAEDAAAAAAGRLCAVGAAVGDAEGDD